MSFTLGLQKLKESKAEIQLTLGKGEIGNPPGLSLCLMSAFLYTYVALISLSLQTTFPASQATG